MVFAFASNEKDKKGIKFYKSWLNHVSPPMSVFATLGPLTTTHIVPKPSSCAEERQVDVSLSPKGPPMLIATRSSP